MLKLSQVRLLGIPARWLLGPFDLFSLGSLLLAQEKDILDCPCSLSAPHLKSLSVGSGIWHYDLQFRWPAAGVASRHFAEAELASVTGLF